MIASIEAKLGSTERLHHSLTACDATSVLDEMQKVFVLVGDCELDCERENETQRERERMRHRHKHRHRERKSEKAREVTGFEGE